MSLEVAGERQLRRDGQRKVGCAAEWLSGLGKVLWLEAAAEWPWPSGADGAPWEARLWKLGEVPPPRSLELVPSGPAGEWCSRRGQNHR